MKIIFKNNYTLIFFTYILTCNLFFNYCYSTQIDGNVSNSGQPIIIYKNPSLLSYESPYCIGINNVFNDSILSVQTGGIIRQDNSSFSVGYEYTDIPNHFYKKLSAGFGQKESKYMYGAAFHYLLKEKTASFTCDLSGGLNLSSSRKLTITAQNILDFDSLHNELPLMFSLSFSGPVFKGRKLLFDSEVFTKFDSLNTAFYKTGFTIALQNDFFKNPALNIYFKSGIENVLDEDMNMLFEGGAGVNVNIMSTTCGLFGGYRALNDDNMYYISLNFSKLKKSLKVKHLIMFDVNTHKISPNGDEINDELLMSINCGQLKKKKKLKSWTLVIVKSSRTERNIIKSYSGGGVPPSTISWDCRDYKGVLQKPGTYFVRFIAVDQDKNVIKTEWIEILIIPVG